MLSYQTDTMLNINSPAALTFNTQQQPPVAFLERCWQPSLLWTCECGFIITQNVTSLCRLHRALPGWETLQERSFLAPRLVWDCVIFSSTVITAKPIFLSCISTRQFPKTLGSVLYTVGNMLHCSNHAYGVNMSLMESGVSDTTETNSPHTLCRSPNF